MFGSMGITELVLILFIVLVIFGAGKLPQLGEGLGKAIKGFKKSVHEADAIELEASKQGSEGQPGAPPAPEHGAPAQSPPPMGTPGAPQPPQTPVAPGAPKS